MLQVCFDCYGTYTTDSVYQWDLNRRLAIRGLDYDSAPAIHFSNKKSTEALVVQSTIEDGVIYCDVPNILLQEPYDIVGYVCECLDQELTTYETIRIPVKPRVKPADYAYENNVEILTYYSLMSEITSVKASTERDLYSMNASKASKAELNTVKAEVENLDNEIANVENEIATERARIDQIVASPEIGEGDLEKEVGDLRIDTKGTTHGSAGTAVREQILGLDAKIDANVSTLSSEIEKKTKNIYPPITSEPFAIMPGGYADSMLVSVNDGIYDINCVLTEKVSYAGVGLILGKTAEEMTGKKVLIVFRETNMLPYTVYLSNGNAWGGTNVVRNSMQPTSNIIEITTDSSLNYGSNVLRLLFNFGLNLTGNIKASFSVYISDITNENMVRYAEYALKATIPELVPHAQYADSSGYDNSCLKNFEQIVSQNSGKVLFDGIATFETTLENMNTSTGFAFSIASIDMTKHIKKCRGILLDKEDSVEYAYLSNVYNSWTTANQILKLENGYNDITNIDLSQYTNVYLLIGVAHVGSNPIEKRGKASVFCIPKSEVVASRLLNVDEFVSKADVIRYDNSIVCWGDSLTAQGGWTDKLSELSGLPVYNGGTGGENIRAISARQGADVMTINNITIPGDTTPVTLATFAEGGINTEFGYKVKPLLQGGTHVNPVSIGNIFGTLKWTGSNYADTTGKWTFTRSEVGEEVVINRPTGILTAFDREKNNPHLMIIFMGTNGGFDNLDDLVNTHKLMIEHSNARHTIILGVTYFANVGNVQEYETKMRQSFGRYFISLRDYLSKYGLEDAGLTPTTEDINAMNKGEVPAQLLSDGVHYTTACKEVIGNMLYKKCCELGIF